MNLLEVFVCCYKCNNKVRIKDLYFIEKDDYIDHIPHSFNTGRCRSCYEYFLEKSDEAKETIKRAEAIQNKTKEFNNELKEMLNKANSDSEFLNYKLCPRHIYENKICRECGKKEK